MEKLKVVSIFFLVLFTIFMITPSVVIIIDTDSDISYFAPLSEEEQNGEERVFSEKPTKLLNNPLFISFLSFTSLNSSSDFLYNKNWTRIYFDTISPPPECA